MTDDDGLVSRLDRLSLARLARAQGLPEALAVRVAQIVSASGLPEDRRSEVFRELIAHFEDGLAAGKTAEELLANFGNQRETASLIRSEKRIVTPEALGGSGNRDGLIRRMARDARYAVRRLVSRPAFTATAILSLALGIGANSAMFTLINELLFRQPSVEKPEELVDVYLSSQNYPFTPLSYPDIVDLSRLTDVFSGVIGARLGFTTVTGADQPERLSVQLVTGNYFEVLGVRPRLGRLIAPEDAPAPGSGTVIVLSDRYWRRAFGADRSVIGRDLKLTSGTYTVIGVTPAEFTSFRGIAIDVYLPHTRVGDLMGGDASDLTTRGNHSTFARARLAPGVTLPRAKAALAALAADLRQRREEGWRGATAFSVIPTDQVIVYPPVDKLLAPLAGMMTVVVGLVLIIACANLAGFLLARAVDRRREIAVRLSLGATQRQLVSQLLVETIILALAGGVVGLGLAQAALHSVMAADLPIPIPLDLRLTVDWRVLGFSLLVSILAGAISGLAPALQSTRLDLASVIRDESTGGGRAKGALRSLLVAGQVAVAVVLLITAGLFVRSLAAVQRFDPGFGRHPAALAWVAPPGSMTTEQTERTIELVKRRLAELPGVTGVGATQNVHLNLLNTSSMAITIEGVEPPPGEVTISVDQATIDTGLLAVVGLELKRGRNFTAFDTRDTPRVAIVNEAFAARYWPDRESVGQRFRDGTGAEVEVVGVVNTAKIRSLAEDPRPFIYRPEVRIDNGGGFLIVAGPSPETILAQTLRVLRETAPDLMVIEAGTLQRHIEKMSLPVKLAARAISAFALLALLMACIGIYGTVSYAVAQRSREVGIRLSLGAEGSAVIGLLLWGGLRLVLIGASVGLVLGFGFGRILEGLLFGVRAFDPLTLVTVPVVLVLVAATAAYLPARRAGRISPVSALKAE